MVAVGIALAVLILICGVLAIATFRSVVHDLEDMADDE